jgi:hypothetical protein
MSDDNYWNSLLAGLLGQPPQNQPPQGLLGAVEPPSIPARIGRGAYDVWEPIKQAWLNLSDPAAARAYLQERAENERLYNRGMQSVYAQGAGTQRVGAQPSDTDAWRLLGRGLPFAPLALPGLMGAAATMTPEALGGLMLSGSAYQALDDLRRRLGVFQSTGELGQGYPE